MAGPAKPSLQERRAAATRQEILTETRRVLGVQGIEATTMGDIAKAVNITRATLYAYFPSKDDLVAQTIADTVSTFSWMDEEGSDREDLRASLTSFLDRRRDQLSENATDFLFLHRLFDATFTPGVREMVDGLLTTFAASVEKLLVAAQGRGEISTDLDLPAVAEDLLAAALGIDRLYLHDPERFPYGPAAHRLVDRILASLTVR